MGLLVLHVDDDKDYLDLISILLQRQQHELTIDSVSCPKEALKYIKHRDYDMVISDFQMPKLTGLDFLKIIRQQGIKTPFVLLTGCGYLREKLKNKLDYFLDKRCNIKEQVKQLSQILCQLAK